MKSSIACFALLLAPLALCAPILRTGPDAVEAVTNAASRPPRVARPPLAIEAMVQKVMRLSAATKLNHQPAMTTDTDTDTDMDADMDESTPKVPANSDVVVEEVAADLFIPTSSSSSSKQQEQQQQQSEELPRRRKHHHHIKLPDGTLRVFEGPVEVGFLVESVRVGLPCRYARKARRYDDTPAVFVVLVFFLFVVAAELGGAFASWVRFSLLGRGAIRLEEGADSRLQPVSVWSRADNGSMTQSEKRES